jgi:hypothetical protein
MKKTLLMIAGFALVFSAAIACFSPSSKKDESSPVHSRTNDVPQTPSTR